MALPESFVSELQYCWYQTLKETEIALKLGSLLL